MRDFLSSEYVIGVMYHSVLDGDINLMRDPD